MLVCSEIILDVKAALEFDNQVPSCNRQTYTKLRFNHFVSVSFILYCYFPTKLLRWMVVTISIYCFLTSYNMASLIIALLKLLCMVWRWAIFSSLPLPPALRLHLTLMTFSYWNIFHSHCVDSVLPHFLHLLIVLFVLLIGCSFFSVSMTWDILPNLLSWIVSHWLFTSPLGFSYILKTDHHKISHFSFSTLIICPL